MKELEKEFKKMKISKSKFEYDMVLNVIRCKRVHTVKRTSTYVADFTKEVVKIISDLGSGYEIGNDAPRGGKIGTYVEITEANRRTYTISKIIGNK